MSQAPFLDDAELRKLTGRHFKSKQAEWLRKAGIPFFLTATGHPAVLWSAVTGRDQPASPEPRGWSPRVVGAR